MNEMWITMVAVHARPMYFYWITKKEIRVHVTMTVNHKLFLWNSISWCVHTVFFICICLFCLDTDINVFLSEIFNYCCSF
jgi:hypothetical protein